MGKDSICLVIVVALDIDIRNLGCCSIIYGVTRRRIIYLHMYSENNQKFSALGIRKILSIDISSLLLSEIFLVLSKSSLSGLSTLFTLSI